ncbi:hypothetical protein FVE85_2630 [Porphyridium purpureum]|uniref:Uncharacterized protein n=1 Tax=Porphyridium purpureum TaxID=35688 RepID=A0A5J4YSL3_PORPP|nr:hypothetical protein FVE85_2630 [Porphyridium purpureum]|eukprot:POR6509..scf227_4
MIIVTGQLAQSADGELAKKLEQRRMQRDASDNYSADMVAAAGTDDAGNTVNAVPVDASTSDLMARLIQKRAMQEQERQRQTAQEQGTSKASVAHEPPLSSSSGLTLAQKLELKRQRQREEALSRHQQQQEEEKR